MVCALGFALQNLLVKYHIFFTTPYIMTQTGSLHESALNVRDRGRSANTGIRAPHLQGFFGRDLIRGRIRQLRLRRSQARVNPTKPSVTVPISRFTG